MNPYVVVNHGRSAEALDGHQERWMAGAAGGVPQGQEQVFCGILDQVKPAEILWGSTHVWVEIFKKHDSGRGWPKIFSKPRPRTLNQGQSWDT